MCSKSIFFNIWSHHVSAPPNSTKTKPFFFNPSPSDCVQKQVKLLNVYLCALANAYSNTLTCKHQRKRCFSSHVGIIFWKLVCRVSDEVIWLVEEKCLGSLFPAGRRNEGKVLEGKCSVDGRGPPGLQRPLKSCVCERVFLPHGKWITPV